MQNSGSIVNGAGAAGIKVSASIGTSKSESTTSTHITTSQGSTVKAGGSVNIKATESDITIQGSTVDAAQNITLDAKQNVNLLASADTESNRSSNKSSSASLGLSLGTDGLTIDVSASKGKGKANSDSTTYNNTQINAGNTLTIKSGNDTNIVGANANGQTIALNVGGNLNVASLQDSATSTSQQKNTGFSASIPLAGSGSFSVNQSKQNSQSDYLSVNQQSGISAGSGGFNITVAGNTDLKGAVITSSAAPSQNTLTTQTLTSSDLQNQMTASASSSSINLSSGMASGNYAAIKGVIGNLMNNGKASESDRGATSSGISAGQITVGSTTTDTSKVNLLDSLGKTVSTNTANANDTVRSANLVGLETHAAKKQADSMLLFSTLSVIGDKVYRKETDAKKTLRLACESDNKEKCSATEVKVDQVKAVDGKIIAFNNGMLNNEEQAVLSAYMQASGKQLQDGVVVIVNPALNDYVSEGAWVLWKKVEQVFGFGTSSVGELNLALESIAAEQGAKYDPIAHSAGNFGVAEMNRRIEEAGRTDSVIGTQTMFGSPVNAQGEASRINTITNGQGTVQQGCHENDFVCRSFGANPSTGGNPNAGALPAHSGYTGDRPTSTNTAPQVEGVRNILSPEEIRDRVDRNWRPGQYSVPVIVAPNNQPRSLEGELK